MRMISIAKGDASGPAGHQGGEEDEIGARPDDQNCKRTSTELVFVFLAFLRVACSALSTVHKVQSRYGSILQYTD